MDISGKNYIYLETMNSVRIIIIQIRWKQMCFNIGEPLCDSGYWKVVKGYLDSPLVPLTNVLLIPRAPGPLSPTHDVTPDASQGCWWNPAEQRPFLTRREHSIIYYCDVTILHRVPQTLDPWEIPGNDTFRSIEMIKILHEESSTYF